MSYRVSSFQNQSISMISTNLGFSFWTISIFIVGKTQGHMLSRSPMDTLQHETSTKMSTTMDDEPFMTMHISVWCYNNGVFTTKR